MCIKGKPNLFEKGINKASIEGEAKSVNTLNKLSNINRPVKDR